MIFHPPMVVGLTLCEDVIVEAATQNLSLIRTFTVDRRWARSTQA